MLVFDLLYRLKLSKPAMFRGPKSRKKSHSASETRRYSYKKDRAQLASAIAQLGSDHDEAAIESNDESGDSSSEIDANELTSRYE